MEHEMKVKCNDCGSEFEITPIHHLKYINGGCPICHKHKTRTCSKCGREFEVNHHYADSIVFVCKECKDKEKIGHRKRSTINRIQRTKEEQNQYDKMRSRLYRQNKEYTCPCCGQKHKYKEKCQTSDLCRRHPQRMWYKTLIPFGFDYSKIGTPEYVNEYYKALEVIKTEYFINKLSPRQIYEKYNCQEYGNIDNIRNILKSEKLETRDISESLYYAIKTGAYENIHPFPFKKEYHTSWNGKRFLLRSSYETDYAKFLDKQHIDYEVEFFRIKYFNTQDNKEHIALPDFYLPDTNTIVEIKSTYTLDVQNMKDKMNAYLTAGYNFKLILEHKECDLNEITQAKTNEDFKELKEKYKRPKKFKTNKNKRWMHNNIERILVEIDEINHYRQMGWILEYLTPQKQKENIANGVQPCAKLLDISEDN